MGSCLSFTSSPEQIANDDIDQQLRETKRTLATQHKVLLLGAGDSGKSTILKQMRIINAMAFDKAELEAFRHLIFENLVEAVIKLVEAMDEINVRLERKAFSLLDRVERAPDICDGQPFPQEYLSIFQIIWSDPAVVAVLNHESRGNELALPDSIAYFFSHLPRLFTEGYQPSDEDIVHARARTMGIKEAVFKVAPRSRHEIRMFDVSGQKSERRKWIHCFEDVTAVLFLVSLSGFDTCLVEERELNQMQDSMAIWDSVVNSKWFVRTSIILFLNKEDIFRKKLAHSNIKIAFPDYEGKANDVEAGKEYFKRRFLKIGVKASRQIYTYFTTATNTKTMKVVMKVVMTAVSE